MTQPENRKMKPKKWEDFDVDAWIERLQDYRPTMEELHEWITFLYKKGKIKK